MSAYRQSIAFQRRQFKGFLPAFEYATKTCAGTMSGASLILFATALLDHPLSEQGNCLLRAQTDTTVTHGTPIPGNGPLALHSDISHGTDLTAQAATDAGVTYFQLIRVSRRLSIKP